MERKHAIIVIKNEQGEYLQYYDNRWNSYMFLNLKVDSKFNEEKIKEEIIQRFAISIENINVKYLMNKLHTKFSESAKIYKEYRHYFYSVSLDKMTNEMKQKEFNIDDIQYKWFKMNELESDERIQKVNNDIVSYVKDLKLD